MQTIFVADANCDNGKRFVVHADEKLTAFLELESVIRRAIRDDNRVNARERAATNTLVP